MILERRLWLLGRILDKNAYVGSISAYIFEGLASRNSCCGFYNDACSNSRLYSRPVQCASVSAELSSSVEIAAATEQEYLYGLRKTQVSFLVFPIFILSYLFLKSVLFCVLLDELPLQLIKDSLVNLAFNNIVQNKQDSLKKKQNFALLPENWSCYFVMNLFLLNTPFLSIFSCILWLNIFF